MTDHRPTDHHAQLTPHFVWLTPLDPAGQVLPQEAIAVSAILAVVCGSPRPHPSPTFAEQTFTPGATIVLGHGWTVDVQETPQEVIAACTRKQPTEESPHMGDDR